MRTFRWNIACFCNEKQKCGSSPAHPRKHALTKVCRKLPPGCRTGWCRRVRDARLGAVSRLQRSSPVADARQQFLLAGKVHGFGNNMLHPRHGYGGKFKQDELLELLDLRPALGTMLEVRGKAG